MASYIHTYRNHSNNTIKDVKSMCLKSYRSEEDFEETSVQKYIKTECKMDHQKNPQESKDSSSTMIIQKPLSTVEEMHIDIYTHKIMTYLNKISNLLSSLRTQNNAGNQFFFQILPLARGSRAIISYKSSSTTNGD